MERFEENLRKLEECNKKLKEQRKEVEYLLRAARDRNSECSLMEEMDEIEEEGGGEVDV